MTTAVQPAGRSVDFCLKGSAEGNFGVMAPTHEPGGRPKEVWGELSPLNLPTDRKRAATMAGRGRRVAVDVTAETADLLCRGASAEEGATRLLAAVGTLVHRYTGQQDIVIGSKMLLWDRTRASIAPENALLVRMKFCGGETFRDLVPKVRQNLAEANEHSRLPYQVGIEFVDGFATFEEEPECRATSQDLTFLFRRVSGGFEAQIEYCCDLFDRATIVRMAEHLKVLLNAVAADPGQPVDQLLILTERERQQVLVDWNRTETAYEDKCVHELFEKQALRTPDATALVSRDQTFTYQQLNERAERLAQHLRKRGIRADTLVGVCLERSPAMLISQLAILKAGGAYVPLDPMYPRERLAFMAADAQLALLITQKQRASEFDLPEAKVLCVDSFDWEAIAEACVSRPPEGLSPQNLAYVIYTSGSTGKPKGVMVTHRNVANFFTGMDEVIGREAGVWLAVTSICFDISVLELLWTLSRGFKVVLQPDRHAVENRADAIPAQIFRHGVTHFQCTPSLAAMLMQEPDGLKALRTVKKVLLGGEPLPAWMADKLTDAVELINVYGPTETTVWSTACKVRAGEGITIGRAIANTQIYILDRNLQPSPIGVPGEIYIGGTGVTRGYLNRPELTAERFIENPLMTEGAARMYRTGDLGRWLPDGRIECLGRADFQVKIRGFRIEPGEIEALLREHPEVREAVVTAREYGAGDTRLVAYCVPKNGAVALAELRDFVRGRMPDYMVPSAFVSLKALPLTPNGKVDRKALPPQEMSEDRQSSAVPPTELPLDHPRPSTPTLKAARHTAKLPKELADGLQALSTSLDVTVEAMLLAAYASLISKLTLQEENVVGLRVRGFTAAAATDRFGLLPIRMRCGDEETFATCAKSTERLYREATSNSSRVSALNELEPMPPVSVALAVREVGEQASFEDIDGLSLDLAFEILRSGDIWEIDCTFNSELIDDTTAQRWVKHFQTLLENIVRQPNAPLGDLSLLTPTERRQVVEEWNATDLSYPRQLCLHHRFEEQAARSPGATAIICGERTITYGELNARANQLARLLVKHGARADGLVGVWLDRTEELVIALLAVLKSGAAYLPLDASYPQERLQYMLEDTGARLLITQSHWLPHLPANSAKTICIDAAREEIRAEAPTQPDAVDHNAANLAYVIYTSGSTGRPKGVAIEHASATAFIHWAREVFTAEELAGTLASTSVCFDLSIFEIFAPLSWGGTVILADNVMQLPHLPARDRVTLVNTVPSAAGDLLRAKGVPGSVTTFALAGEPLTTRLVDDLYALEHVAKVYDLYGPSETTTYSTFVLRYPGERATVGKPLANTQIYIVDGRFQPTPIGVPGEICIGGAGLARGYLNAAEATTQKFVPDPFRAGSRVYRTGDLGRWLPNGDIEFLGRRDHQVKIRGYRIELGEIETVMSAHPSVRETAAVVRGENLLAGYVVIDPDRPVTVSEFRQYLRQKLPDYMVPTSIVFLDTMPRTPSGKVNRKALPAPTETANETPSSKVQVPNEFQIPNSEAADAVGVAEITPIEETLAQIWRDVIGIKNARVDDNFFDVGGHSVLAVQVLARVRIAFQVDLTLRNVFEAPTIAQMAHVIEARLIAELDEIPEEQPGVLEEA
jgi:amino acid adenylation domain-containing protein